VRKRQLVDHAWPTWEVRIRRACRALPVDRSTYHYRSRRAGQAHLTERIREIAATRVRYGYRRIHVLLRLGGGGADGKRAARWACNCGTRRRSAGSRQSYARIGNLATRPNETWNDGLRS